MPLRQQNLTDSVLALPLDLAYAHEVIQGYTVLMTNVKDAIAHVSKPLYQLTDTDLEEIRENLEIIEREVDAQNFDAWNWLSHFAEETAMLLQAPVIRRKSPFDLLCSMLPAYQPEARNRHIEIRVEGVGNEMMPAIEMAENMLRRAFHNVLSNALKYSHGSTVFATRFIQIQARRHDPEGIKWAVSVQNYGVGIGKDELVHVFEPGFRGALARRENVFGVGLGLSEVQKCMLQHEGYVKIASEQQHDETYLTTVTLIFPRYTNIRRRIPHARVVD